MKTLVFVFAVVFSIGVSNLSAKNLPSVAEKLPANLKQELVDNLKYPIFASENAIEGEVWIKATLTNNSKVEVLDVSATNQELGDYVKKELSDIMVKTDNAALQNVYYFKVKFHLIEN